MWRNFINPPNNVSDEEDYHSSDEVADPGLVSPRRPHQSPTASPRALLRPDPPPVEEVLANVDRELSNLPARDQRAERRNAHRAELEAAEEAAAAAAAAQAAMAVAYDLQNTENGEKAQELGRQIKVEFSTTDIKFWFSEFEAEMLMAGIGKQWLKKTVLQRNLPTKQKEDVKSLLTLTEDQRRRKF